MGWRVGLNESAEVDLGNVVAFLAQRNPASAERLGLKLVETLFSLAEFPHRGVVVHGRPGYRRILHRPWFLVFYRIDEPGQTVEIVRIWDARQDPAMFALD